ncbi:MAG: galactose-1-phosphate uridylyltransferase [Clostridiales bacterium]|nr:galactose-1-phosphate uridylyltransferase [Clostridiales bacterium]
MSELRKDIISGRWVIIAAERGKRPDDFRPAPVEKIKEPAGFCPFCEGNESKTPREVYALRKNGKRPDRPGWLVRVVPNKFPALTRGIPPVQHEDGIFRWMDGVGVHEVVIETPDHDKELSDLPLYHLQHVLETYKKRVVSIEEEFQYKYVHVFKNKGREAGASLSHPHSQIVATPIIPKKVNEELYGCERLHRQYGECIVCRIIRDETRKGDRLILRNDHFCVVAPFAPRFPFEMRIYPLRHSAWYTSLTKAESFWLARTLRTTLGKLKTTLSDPPYNFYIHQAPNPNLPHEAWANVEESFHWHFEIIPVLTRVAGFEWGTGFYINPVPPETAAGFVRGSG